MKRANVLFAWELGGNLGHITSMLALARNLRDKGHHPVFAVRDLSNALLLVRERFAFFAAPGRTYTRQRGAYPSYAAMLSGEVFPSETIAVAAALAWRSIIHAVRPELLIADHAPAALLAARSIGLRVAIFGAPFSVPVTGRPLPVFGKPSASAYAGEEDLLERLNRALAVLGGPKLDSAADLYRADATMVRGLPENDCFAPRPRGDYVSTSSADAGEAVPEWPAAKGAKVLVYLRSGPWLEPVCDALAARGASAIAYISGLDDKAAAKLERPGLFVARQPCKFSELIEQSDLVLCHAGNSTVTASILAGKPLVMIPTYVEQFLTSARVVAAGAGAVPARSDVRSIARGLDVVAPGSPAQIQARRIAAKHRGTANPPPQAVERIEALLTSEHETAVARAPAGPRKASAASWRSSMHPVRHLEIHVAHACNLKCQSCSHYSDQGHKGVVSLADAERWMSAWSARLRVGTFSLVGGEPTIHPELAEFVRLARRHWPDSHLRLVTNGFFLHNHPELPRVLQGDKKARIFLSIHHDAPEYLDALRPNHDLLKSWEREYGIQASTYRSLNSWRHTYLGAGPAMQPYEDAAPRQSWQNCESRKCPQLFDAKIWKCSPLAYLGMQNEKHKLSEKWAPYLGYEPLKPDCTDGELAEFFSKEDEPYCGMCPAKPEKFNLPMPMARPMPNRPLARVSLQRL